jgi:hypothetical protein
MIAPMSGATRLERSRVSQRGMALLAAFASALIASATVHGASSASFFDVHVTVVRSCRISTDAVSVDRTPLEIDRTLLGMACANAASATPQIDLGLRPYGDDPIGWMADGLIASVRPTGLARANVEPRTLRLTINF